MQLLCMTQDVCQEVQESSYIVKILRSNDISSYQSIDVPDSSVSMHPSLNHAIFCKSDPYNRFCDHVLVYERKQGLLVASSRVLAWQNIQHLQDIGGFSCQEQFDILGLKESLSKTIELSHTFLKPKTHRVEVMVKLWAGIMHLLKAYDAQYMIGVLSLDFWSSMHSVRSLLRHSDVMPISDCSSPVFARTPFVLSASPFSAQESDFSILEQLKAVDAEVAGEANTNLEKQSVEFFVRVKVENLMHAKII